MVFGAVFIEVKIGAILGVTTVVDTVMVVVLGIVAGMVEMIGIGSVLLELTCKIKILIYVIKK